MNGNGWKNWMLGALFTIALGLGSLAFSSVAARVERLEAASATRAQQVAVLETEMKNVEVMLKRIEDKLDRLLNAR